jgi:hypothetical protein
MNTDYTPPLVLGSGRVVAYAIVDGHVRWTGLQRLYAGDELLGPVPRLAIVQNIFDEDYFLLLCNSDWEVLAVTSGSDESEIKSRAERWYCGISRNWVQTDTTRKDAEDFLRLQDQGSYCSFCGKHAIQTDATFSSGLIGTPGVNICSDCVETLYKNIRGETIQSTDD